MSFAQEVRKELIDHYNKSLHCRTAQQAAELLFKGEKGQEESLSKLIGVVTDAEQKQQLDRITAKTCCKRAFLRAAFIAAGTISDPEKHYHLEIICETLFLAEYVQELMRAFDINAKIAKRRDRHIVYIKEGVEIADMLNVMEAHVALMNFENIRIVREMRGNVNRKVNCETANIEKTVTAAMKQIEDINYLNETTGLSVLDESLKQIALVRLENPDLPLSALGEKLTPPIGKSGVNHRLRKISRIAEELKNQS